MSCFFRFALSL